MNQQTVAHVSVDSKSKDTVVDGGTACRGGQATRERRKERTCFDGDGHQLLPQRRHQSQLAVRDDILEINNATIWETHCAT